MTPDSPDSHLHQLRRARALRRAWRTFWWMVVRAKPRRTLSRRIYLGIAFREARCGLMTSGDHAWGPLEYEYEGARWRKQSCRWCRATHTPASEIDRNPPTEDDLRRAQSMICKPTEGDVERALELARKAGVYRDGKFLWD